MDHLSKATRRAGLLGVLLLIWSALCGCAAVLPAQPVTAVTFVMNTVVEYRLYAPEAQAQEAIQAVEQMLRDLENRMSLYLDSSEIQQLNNAAGSGEWVPLSEDTFTLLERAKQFCLESGGAFDPTIAPLTELWSITSDHPHLPSQQELDALLPLVDVQGLELDPEHRAARLTQPGMAVDLGGAAKGYACSRAWEILQEHKIRSGDLSIGGNLLVVGRRPDGNQFKFGLRDPRGTAKDYIATVALEDTTMATSGDYERFFEQDGVRYHHILDPKTGRPAEGGLMSVSVVTDDGALADLLSTALFVQGREAALEQINSIPGCGLILIDTDKNVYISQSLAQSVSPAGSSETYRFEVVK